MFGFTFRFFYSSGLLEFIEAFLGYSSCFEKLYPTKANCSAYLTKRDMLVNNSSEVTLDTFVAYFKSFKLKI